MRSRPIRAQVQSTLPARNRFTWLFHFIEKLGQPFPERGVVRLQLDRPVQPDQGVGDLALALQNQPKVGIGQGKIRIELQSVPGKRPGRRPNGRAPRRTLPRLWCSAAELGWSRTPPDCALELPRPDRDLTASDPGRLRAAAKAGSNSTARRKCLRASCRWPVSVL